MVSIPPAPPTPPVVMDVDTSIRKIAFEEFSSRMEDWIVSHSSYCVECTDVLHNGCRLRSRLQDILRCDYTDLWDERFCCDHLNIVQISVLIFNILNTSSRDQFHIKMSLRANPVSGEMHSLVDISILHSNKSITSRNVTDSLSMYSIQCYRIIQVYSNIVIIHALSK